jgi:hypothetical protein
MFAWTTRSPKDNALRPLQLRPGVLFVPGGSPGFAEANAFGSNERIINHARNAAIGETHVFSPNMLNQASFGYNRIFDYIASQGTGTCASATIVPGAFPTPTWDAPNGTCASGSYSCGLVSTSSQAAIGPSAIAATLRSRVEPTSSPSKTTLDLIRGKA